MENQKPKKRIEIIDLIKALTIVLVVWGHVVGNTEAPYYRMVIYTFHMPLFFFLAGMSMRVAPVNGFEEWIQFLKRNFLALMVPYFIWGMIFNQSSYGNVIKLLYGSWEALTEMNTLSPLWFLPCLFMARLIVQLMVNLVERKVSAHRKAAYWLVIAALFAIGFTLPHGNGWFWGTDLAFVAAGFIVLGLLLKGSVLALNDQRTAVIGGVFAASLALFVLALILCPQSLILMRMCAREYGNLLWFFYYSILGSLVTMTLAMLLEKAAHAGAHPFNVSYFNYIGMHTMGIYLLHKPFLQGIIYPCVCNLLPGVNETITSLISTLIMIPICCLFCMIIERFIPELLGQFPRENN